LAFHRPDGRGERLPLRGRALEGRADVVHGSQQRAAGALDAAQDDDRDQRGDQGVLDGRAARSGMEEREEQRPGLPCGVDPDPGRDGVKTAFANMITVWSRSRSGEIT
jgi:hypothetical protein